MRTVYLDMDGVLADFDNKSIELIGKRLRDFPDSMSGWAAMEKHQNIYRILDRMPDSDALVCGVMMLARQCGFSVAVLSAIPKFGRMPSAKSDKKKWLAEHYPHLLHDFNIGPWAQDKYKHANPGDVLIDDSELNVPQWNDAGGFGILHIDAKTSLQKLKDYLHADGRG